MDEGLLRDTLYAGGILWLAGYLASMAVYFSDLDYAVWGRVVLLLYLPCAAVFAWLWFRERTLPLGYYAGVGLAWSLVAVALDIPFIVLRFGSWDYYGGDVYCYYLAMVLIPVGAGMYIRGSRNREKPKE